MKTIRASLLAVLLFSAFDAKAVFIPFIIPFSIKAKPGDLCVTTSTKVGDVKTSPNGSTITIKSISGSSGHCKDPALPILAHGEYAASTTFSDKAGLDIPKGYDVESLTDMQKFGGGVLMAKNRSTDAGIYVTALKGELISDLDTYAANVKTNMTTRVDDAKQSAIETLVINGLPARRFSTDGKVKNIFGTRYTYLMTIMQGADEVVAVNVWAPTVRYETLRAELQHVAETINGLNPPNSIAPDSKSGAIPPAPLAVTDVKPVPATPPVPPAAEPAPAPASRQDGDKSTATSEGKPALSPSTDTPENRLRRLNQLFAEGLITQDEYEAKKAEILKTM